MLGLLFLNYYGLMYMSIFYSNEYYIQSASIGGVIMGAGFIIGGFCPGTSVCAAAIGKIDAMYFILGSLIGIFVFGVGFPLYESMYNADYLGGLKLTEVLSISDGVIGFVVIVMAVMMFWIGEKAEKKFERKDITSEI
jgi:hypothetical protein